MKTLLVFTLVLVALTGCNYFDAGARLERECASIIDTADKIKDRPRPRLDGRPWDPNSYVIAELSKKYPVMDIPGAKEHARARWEEYIKGFEESIQDGERGGARYIQERRQALQEDLKKGPVGWMPDQQFLGNYFHTHHKKEWDQTHKVLWDRANDQYQKNERPEQIAACVLERGHVKGAGR